MRYQWDAVTWMIVAAAGGLLLWSSHGYLDQSGDSAEYIRLARSLAHGTGYEIMGDPSVKYPPGFPALLSVIERLAPGQWQWMRLPAVAGYLGIVALLAAASPLAAALCATAPVMPLFGHQVMADVPLALLVLAGLLLLRDERLSRTVGGFACLWVAWYVKSIAVVFVVAALLELVCRRDWRLVIGMALASVAVMAPWSLWCWTHGDATFYATQLWHADPYRPDAGELSVFGLVARALAHCGPYLAVLPALAAVFVLAQFTGGHDRRDRALWLGLGVYLPVMCAWPFWAHRFLVPVVPIVALLTAGALQRSWVAHARRWWVFAAMAAVIVATQLVSVNPAAARALPHAWQQYQEAGEWLRDNTPPETVICARKPHWLTVVSGRECIGFPYASPEAIFAWWDRYQVRYVVVEQLGFSQTDRYLMPAIVDWKGGWKVAWFPTSPGEVQCTIIERMESPR